MVVGMCDDVVQLERISTGVTWLRQGQGQAQGHCLLSKLWQRDVKDEHLIIPHRLCHCHDPSTTGSLGHSVMLTVTPSTHLVVMVTSHLLLQMVRYVVCKMPCSGVARGHGVHVLEIRHKSHKFIHKYKTGKLKTAKFAVQQCTCTSFGREGGTYVLQCPSHSWRRQWYDVLPDIFARNSEWGQRRNSSDDAPVRVLDESLESVYDKRYGFALSTS